MKFFCPLGDDVSEVGDVEDAGDSVIEVGIEIDAEFLGCS
jgi:hypothetical protein